MKYYYNEKFKDLKKSAVVFSLTIIIFFNFFLFLSYKAYSRNIINVSDINNIGVKTMFVNDNLKGYHKNNIYISNVNNKYEDEFKIFAQQPDRIITGTVTDSLGNPLIGVTVRIKGSEGGAKTDVNGDFVIRVKGTENVLIFTYLGYNDKAVNVDEKAELHVVLSENISSLEETVVVAMGKQKKSNVVGSISKIDIEEIESVPKTSIQNLISGRLAGGISVQRSGEIGRKNSSFWIRGISTFGSNKLPLVLIDGVERSMDDISIDEVETVSILKDAVASAVYGSRAANGVILITTKTGAKNTKPVVQANIQYGVTDLPKLPQFVDGAQFLTLYNEASGKSPAPFSKEAIEKTRNGTEPYMYPDVDWIKAVFNNYSQNSKATINVKGGGEHSSYFVGFGYYNEVGNLRNDPNESYKSNLNSNKYAFRTNVSLDITNTTKLSLKAGGQLTDLHTMALGQTLYGTSYTPAEEAFHWANLATPISMPVKVPIDTLEDGTFKMGWGSSGRSDQYNPSERLMGSGYKETYSFNIMSQLSVEQDLSAITEGLHLNVTFAFDAFNRSETVRNKLEPSYSVVGHKDDGTLIIKNIDEGYPMDFHKNLASNRQEELHVRFNYNKQIARKHNLTAMFMYYQRDFRNSSANSTVTSLPHRKQGLAGRIAYNYDERYFLELDAGYNGSENFEKGKRFGLFPALGAGWMISRENFWRNIKPVINTLKIRGSLGMVGSESLPGGNRFSYLTEYQKGILGYAYGGSDRQKYSGVGIKRTGIDDLSWEKGVKRDIGLEMELFQGRISLDIDYFNENRYGILIQRNSLPALVGINENPYANIGRMLNRGMDMSVNLRKEFGKDGLIRLYGNFTFTKNKVIDIDEPNRIYSYQSRTKLPYGTKFGLVAIGYFKDSAEIRKSPEQTYGTYQPGDVKYKDINGDGKIDLADEVPIGYSDVPQINYGFGFQIQYWGFDLGLFFRGQAKVNYGLGGEYIPFSEGLGRHNIYKASLDRWTSESPRQDAQYPRITAGRSSNNWQYSTQTIYDGSFLRLQNVEVGYTFRSNYLKNVIKIRDFRIYFAADNVAILSKWKMWDPETGSRDGTVYPLQRKMNFGIRFKF